MLILFAKLRTGGKMADNEETVGQIKASFLSQQSAGPRTPEGKERSKYNAVKHGIFSKVIVLKREPRAVFDALLDGLFKDLHPEGTLEEILVEKLAILLWRYRRLMVAEAKNGETIAAAEEEQEEGEFVSFVETHREREHLLRYEASIERALDRTLGQLERLQRIRFGQPVPQSNQVGSFFLIGMQS
jgi:hypothetical protein